MADEVQPSARIEHLPHVGSEYLKGIDGQRVAIVGYSHWNDTDDGVDWSRMTIEKVISHQWRIRFFSTIRNLFGYSNHGEFWQRVIFFNFVPTMIGKGHERFRDASNDEHVRGRERLVEIADEYKPSKIFVFTSKVDDFLPKLGYEPILPDLPLMKVSKKALPGSDAIIYRLRHPQGASGRDLKWAVETAMAR